MRNRFSLVLSAISLLAVSSTGAAETETELFHPNAVTLLEGPFLQSLTLNGRYVLQHDPDRLLVPFLVEAGLEPKAEPYGNWESSGLNGHTGGHYLSILAFMYANTGEAVYKDRLDYMVAELKRCQEANGNGYVGGVPDAQSMWEQVKAGEINAERFSVNGRWVPWYNLHKTFVGLKDAWLVADNEQARATLLELVAWADDLTDGLTEAEMQEMLYAEHGGMNDVFAEIYEHTGDKKHLDLAIRFSHHEILRPLARGEDPLTGLHANTQIPKAIGFQRIANVSDAPDFSDAARNFWENVANQRSVAFGGNSVREHFHAPDDFTSMLESREGPESCNTHNMLRLSAQRFLEAPSASILDFYERGLFNHILSVQHPTTGGLVYFTPIRPQHYRVYSQAESAFWCCVGSGMENPGRYNELIYARQAENLFVNLFIASELNWPERGLRLRQETAFPQESATRLTLELDAPSTFTVFLRQPEWARSGVTARLNDEALTVEPDENGYLSIRRAWQDGDILQLDLPMSPSVEALPDGSNYYAFLYGPIVLAAKSGQEDMPGLFAGDGRMEHIAPGPYYPLGEAPTIIARPEELVDLLAPVPGKPLHFQLSGDIRPAPAEPFILEPFHQIHESRYVMYWQTLDDSQYQKVKEQIEAEDAAQRRREARKVDEVAPGQQQPEVEHDYHGEESRSGSLLGKSFREASGYFAYTLDPQDAADLELVVTYWGSEWGRACAIRVNGNEIGRIEANANDPERFVEARFSIPNELLRSAADDLLAVRIETIDDRATPSIFEVALLRQDSDD